MLIQVMLLNKIKGILHFKEVDMKLLDQRTQTIQL